MLGAKRLQNSFKYEREYDGWVGLQSFRHPDWPGLWCRSDSSLRDYGNLRSRAETRTVKTVGA